MTNTSNMYCARLKETLAMRDAWIKEWGMEQLKKDYNTVLASRGKK